MNKMASNIVDRWLVTASDEDEGILSADFSEDGDVGALGARIPSFIPTDGPKGKASNKHYGKGVKEDKYKWTPKNRGKKCWSNIRNDVRNEHRKTWKKAKKKTKQTYNNNFNDYFYDKSKKDRRDALCYHKNPKQPGQHKDLASVPSGKANKAPEGGDYNNTAYDKLYWAARLKPAKKTANEEMVANIIDRYEP
jgi:hypothetical protein